MNDETTHHTVGHSQQEIPVGLPAISGFTLTVIHGDVSDFGVVFTFNTQTVIIGRSRQAHVRLHDQSISKQHCKIKPTDSTSQPSFSLEDLNSTNGSRLNGALFTGNMILASGDRIELGDTILRFNTQDAIDDEYQHHLIRLATQDPLTHLLNKHSILKELERALQHSDRYQRPLSVMMIDVDHFKNINDTYGHLAGDQVLARIATLISANLRQQDHGGRFGGEEFTVILPETQLSGALILAERIRMTIFNESFFYQSQAISVTISIGLACQTPESQTVSTLLESADQSLYKAKQSGRNQVVSLQTNSI